MAFDALELIIIVVVVLVVALGLLFYYFGKARGQLKAMKENTSPRTPPS